MKPYFLMTAAILTLSLIVNFPQAVQAADCSTHCDCPQGEFCYYGTCIFDPKMPVYCCDKLDSCPPGNICFTGDGARSRCHESVTIECDSACDCGPAHACLHVTGVLDGQVIDGMHCVKDQDDTWLPGPGIGGEIFDDLTYSLERGVDATYCCNDPGCFAAKSAHSDTEQFVCALRDSGRVLSYCVGMSCGSSGDCGAGESCVDTISNPSPPPGTSCLPYLKLDIPESPFCVSNAVAEVIFGWRPSEIIAPCTASCPIGKMCDRGWLQGGGYLLERVVGVCGGTIGNGTCDLGENAFNAPLDCKAPEWSEVCGEESYLYSGYYAMCGDGICDPNGYTPENCMTCPQDCGEAINSDEDFVADCIDECPNTSIPELSVPASGQLGENRWALFRGNFFTQAEPQSESKTQFSVLDTRGCSCEQIIEELGLGSGHIKQGCSTGVMLKWVNQ